MLTCSSHNTESLFYPTGSVLGAKLLSFCLSDINIVIIAIIDNIIGLAVIAVAQNTRILFAGKLIVVYKFTIS